MGRRKIGTEGSHFRTVYPLGRQCAAGDFGISYKYKMDVTRVIEGRIGNTLVLGGIGFLLIFTLALLLGILCAWKEDTWLGTHHL